MPTDLPDRLLARLLSRTPFYAEGWGDADQIEKVMSLLETPGDPRPIDVQWSKFDGLIGEGWFPSPIARDVALPPRARTGYFRLELPERSVDGEPTPVCVFLAATGDQGYSARKFVSGPLVRRGIGALILENPYYGARKPPEQRYVAPRRFLDQLRMNYATVQEARSLLAWLREQGFGPVGVAGYSMGGFMSAYVTASMPFAIASAPCAAGNSAGPTFTESPLSRVPDWARLESEMDEGEDARQRFLDIVNVHTISRWSPPVDPESVVIVGLRRDLIIPRAEVEALHAHWKGSHLRWVDASHMSGVLGRVRAVREAVYDAFAIRAYKEGRGA